VKLFILSLLSAYGAILMGIFLGKIPIVGLISLLTLPIAFKAISILKGNYQDPVKMAPANLGMICTHNFTAILLIIAYTIAGFKKDNLLSSFLPLFTLIVLYLPIAKLISKALLTKRKEEAV